MRNASRAQRTTRRPNRRYPRRSNLDPARASLEPLVALAIRLLAHPLDALGRVFPPWIRAWDSSCEIFPNRLKAYCTRYAPIREPNRETNLFPPIRYGPARGPRTAQV